MAVQILGPSKPRWSQSLAPMEGPLWKGPSCPCSPSSAASRMGASRFAGGLRGLLGHAPGLTLAVAAVDPPPQPGCSPPCPAAETSVFFHTFSFAIINGDAISTLTHTHKVALLCGSARREG